MFAQIVHQGSWGMGHTIGVLIAVVAAVAILIIVVRASDIQIPPWAVKIVWIVLLAVFAIVAVHFIFSQV